MEEFKERIKSIFLASIKCCNLVNGEKSHKITLLVIFFKKKSGFQQFKNDINPEEDIHLNEKHSFLLSHFLSLFSKFKVQWIHSSQWKVIFVSSSIHDEFEIEKVYLSLLFWFTSLIRINRVGNQILLLLSLVRKKLFRFF